MWKTGTFNTTSSKRPTPPFIFLFKRAVGPMPTGSWNKEKPKRHADRGPGSWDVGAKLKWKLSLNKTGAWLFWWKRVLRAPRRWKASRVPTQGSSTRSPHGNDFKSQGNVSQDRTQSFIHCAVHLEMWKNRAVFSACSAGMLKAPFTWRSQGRLRSLSFLWSPGVLHLREFHCWAWYKCWTVGQPCIQKPKGMYLLTIDKMILAFF